jgi:hypothetical protein
MPSVKMETEWVSFATYRKHQSSGSHTTCLISLHIVTSFFDAAENLFCCRCLDFILAAALPDFVDIILHYYCLFCVRTEHAKYTRTYYPNFTKKKCITYVKNYCNFNNLKYTISAMLLGTIK